MKALIVVLLISSLPSLVQARQDSCIAANQSDITNTYQKNVTVKEGHTVRCRIYYGWDAEKEECVTKEYYFSSYPIKSLFCNSAANIPDSIYCACSFTNCNADLRPFTKALEALKTKAENEETNLKNISSRQIERQLIECMLEKSKVTAAMSTTTERTTTTPADAGTSAATEGGHSTSIEGGEEDTTKIEIPEETNENRNELTPSTPKELETDQQTLPDTLSASTSSLLGLFIGSAVFNVLLVVTIVALIVALVKMNKKLGEAKQGTAKVEKKVHQTPTVIQIENPVMNKDSPTVPPPASTTKAADQPEAAADTTGTSLDLDTTGGTSGSDSTGTGPDGFNEVRVSVRGFSRN